MPTTYQQLSTGRIGYRITCGQCDAIIEADQIGPDALNEAGGRVTDTIRFLRGPWRFHSECRECERARGRRARGAAQARSRSRARVPGTVLGLARRFGVEFECIVPRSVDRYTITNALEAAGLSGWRAKGDGSLMAMGAGHGIEVVSPILQGEQGVEAIRVATRVLRELGATVNRTCGTHIHHEARDLTVQNIKDSVKAWATNQHLIDGLVAPSRRNGSNTYCRHLDSSDLARVESCTTLNQLRSGFARYRTLNLDAYGRYGTIEIRQHQGTLDAEKVISWLRFGQAILDRTIEAPATTATRYETVREFLAGLGERLDETAQTFLLGRAVQFNAVRV